MTSTETKVSDIKKYPIREIFQDYYLDYRDEYKYIPDYKQKTAECIMQCKTGRLGYNIAVCDNCGNQQIHAVSCNNRYCPSCQAPLVKKWELERNTELIKGIAYYHVIFTLPHELNDLIKANQKLLLGLLFKCVHETLLTLCADKKYMGAKPGIISVLHTWGQQLSYHPHIHVCISGGGLTPDGRFVETAHKGFFIPEAVLASMFRGKFMCALKKYYNSEKLSFHGSEHLQDKKSWQEFVDSLFEKRWLPFVKETFNGHGNAVKYLARYSFRTAIANSRIVSSDVDTVTFSYKDYRDNNKQKNKTVTAMEFIDRFLQHVLPPGFHRMRFAGYLANCKRSKNLKLIHKLRNTSYCSNPYRKMNTVELMKEIYKIDICKCETCGGRLIKLPRGTLIENLPSLANDSIPAMC